MLYTKLEYSVMAIRIGSWKSMIHGFESISQAGTACGLGFVDRGVQSPVLRLMAQLLCFSFQDDRRECFGDGEEA